MFKFKLKKALYIDEKETLDRRLSERSKKIFIAELYYKGKSYTSTVYNISVSGLGIFLNKDLPCNDDLNITINNEYVNGMYSQRKLNMTLPVKLSWIKKVPESASLQDLNINRKNLMAGVSFQDISSNVLLQVNALWDNN